MNYKPFSYEMLKRELWVSSSLHKLKSQNNKKLNFRNVVIWLKLVLCFIAQSTRSESFSQSIVVYVCNPRPPEAKAGGSSILAYSGKLSNLARSCLKIRHKKGLGIQFSADALDSISIATHLKEKEGKEWKRNGKEREGFFKIKVPQSKTFRLCRSYSQL